ncbi:amino acid permease-domain-containing protein [Suillus lakei]|nr:amino acid permease-domain-containing protein [Suillus lakei]
MEPPQHAISKADEALLAELGYKQEFKRAFTPLEVLSALLCLAIVALMARTITGLCSVLFYALPNGGPASMVWGWAVASLFILCVGMSMAELGSAAPTSGGLYFWTHSLSSPRCRNLLSWIVGYSNTIGTIASVASIDWGCAVQVMAAVSIGSGQTFTATSAQTFDMLLGTAVLARLQTIYVVLNIWFANMNSASYAFGNFPNSNGWPDGYAFILSFLAPSWTIASFDSSVHISEESSNAATAVPWAIVSAIGIAGILGWGINVSLAFCMGTDIDSLLSSPIGQPMAQIFFNSFGQTGTLALWSFVVLVQYMMGSSMVLASSRQTFAFARDGALPFSSYLYRMNSFTKTPVNTVWFVAVISIILGMLSFAGSQAINAIFALSVTGSLPIAVISVSYMFIMNIVFFFPTTAQTDVANMNYTVVVLGGILFLSILWYYCPVYGGVHWFTGPVSNLGKVREESASSIRESVEKNVRQDIGEVPVGA